MKNINVDILLRFLSLAILAGFPSYCFGVWQGSSSAGQFMFGVLTFAVAVIFIVIEREK